MKKAFIRDDIVDAAFQIVRKQGKKKLSARVIAKKLNSSTMPIYSTIHSMKELEKEIDRKFTELFLQYATTPNTGDSLLDSSWGYIRFAKEEKELFRTMFLGDEESEINNYKEQKQEILGILIERLKHEPKFYGLTDRQLRHIMNNMEIVIHGLACLVNYGRLEDESERHIMKILEEFSTFFIQQEKARRKKHEHKNT